ncbi:unnamed protein product, partial [Ectocarpus sp. 12 AP-2014]
GGSNRYRGGDVVHPLHVRAWAAMSGGAGRRVGGGGGGGRERGGFRLGRDHRVQGPGTGLTALHPSRRGRAREGR